MVLGEWDLSDDTINSLANEESNTVAEQVIEINYISLVQKIHKKQYAQRDINSFDVLIFDELNDYDLQEENYVSNSEGTEQELLNPDVVEEESLKTMVLALLKNIRSDTENVQEVVDLISTVGDKHSDLLKANLHEVWEKLESLEEIQKFLKLVAACKTSAHFICKGVLLSKLKQEGKLNFLESIAPVVPWLNSHFVIDTLVPLLIMEVDHFEDETLWITTLISVCSDCQKNKLLRSFVDYMEETFQKYHLQVLCILLKDIPPNYYVVHKLITVLNHNINDLKQNRYLGKVLLILTEAVASGLCRSMMKELSHLCNRFEGVMRFRINKELKKCLSSNT